MAASTSKLGKEVVAYVLGPSDSATSDKGSPSYAAIVSLSNPSASSPLAQLRGTTPFPSSSSLSVVVTQDSTGTLVVHADRLRPLIHVHAYDAASSASSSSTKSVTQTCPLLARLHPSEPTPTLALSPKGDMLAAGSASGRLYLWNITTGHLLASLDAHFRAVSCLQWTACGQAIVSGGEDGRILIWTVEALLSGTDAQEQLARDGLSSMPPMPYAMLADHVEAVTDVVLSSSSSAKAAISSFPNSLRIMSASSDGTVKLWDVRMRTLVATWSMPGPVVRLACDVGFRSLFAVISKRSTASASTEDRQASSDYILRVDLFSPSSDDVRTISTGSSSASMTQVNEGPQTLVHQLKAGKRITAFTMSTFGSHLLVGTSDAQMVTIDVHSGVAIRTSPLLAVGAEGSGGAGAVEVKSLQTLLVHDASSLLQSQLARSSKRSGQGSAWQITDKLDRSLVKHDDQNTPHVFAQLNKQDVHARLHTITPPSLLNKVQSPVSHSTNDQESLRKAQERIEDLQRDNEKLSTLLKRAQATNEGLWQRLVRDAADKPNESMQIDM